MTGPLRVFRVIFLAAMTVFLSACSSLGLGGEDHIEIVQVEQAPPVTVEPLPETSTLLQNAPRAPVQPPADYAALARAQSGGSVEIFSLDDGAAPPDSGLTRPPIDNAPYYAPAVSAQGQAYRGDSNVMVFPFDDSVPGVAVTPGQESSQSSSYMAASMPQSGDAGRIYFRHGSAELNDLDRAFLEKVVAALGRNRRVLVEGHASRRTDVSDAEESHIVNLKMSMKRALAIAQELIRRGVPAENIHTSALGDTQPPRAADPNRDPEAQQRRVEIYAQ